MEVSLKLNKWTIALLMFLGVNLLIFCGYGIVGVVIAAFGQAAGFLSIVGSVLGFLAASCWIAHCNEQEEKVYRGRWIDLSSSEKEKWRFDYYQWRRAGKEKGA